MLRAADGRDEPAYLRYQYAVPLGNAHRHPVPLLVQQAGADGEDLGLIELLDARLGQEDSAGGLGLGLDALDEDAVEEGHEAADGADGGGLSGDIRISVGSLLVVGFVVVVVGAASTVALGPTYHFD